MEMSIGVNVYYVSERYECLFRYIEVVFVFVKKVTFGARDTYWRWTPRRGVLLSEKMVHIRVRLLDVVFVKA